MNRNFQIFSITSMIIICVLGLFKSQHIFDLLDKYWVSPVASNLHVGEIEHLFYISLLGIFFGFLLKSNSVILDAIFGYFNIFIIVVNWRTIDMWEYTGCYFELYTIFTAVYFIYKLCRYAIKHYKIITKKESSSTDNEISDDFNRKDIASKIAKNILKKRNMHESFNFALIGRWGSGKTQLFKLIAEFCDNNTIQDIEDVHVFQFSPWEYVNNNNQEKQLLLSLSASSNTKVNSLFKDYIDLYNSDNSNVIGKYFIRMFSTVLPVSNVKQELEEFLTTNKILILLDDFDRLEKEEMLSTLRAIRNVLNYKNIHFGVGFHFEYVQNKLFGNEIDSKVAMVDYIDKYFQVKIYLPDVDDIKRFFLNKLETEVDISIKTNVIAGFEFFYKNEIAELIRTPRDVENVIYSAIQNSIGLEKDSDFYTHLLLEILKLKEIKTYDFIVENKNKLLNNDSCFTNELPKEFNKITYLLFHSNNSRHPISDSRFFNNYFKFSIGVGQLSHLEFEKTIKNFSNSDNLSSIENLIDEGFGNDIFNKLSWRLKDEKMFLNNINTVNIVNTYIYYVKDRRNIYENLIYSAGSLERANFLFNDSFKDVCFFYWLASSIFFEYNVDTLRAKNDILYFIKENEINRNLFDVLMFVHSGAGITRREFESANIKDNFKTYKDLIEEIFWSLFENRPIYCIYNLILKTNLDPNRPKSIGYTFLNKYLQNPFPFDRLQVLTNKHQEAFSKDITEEIIQFVKTYSQESNEKGFSAPLDFNFTFSKQL